MTFRPRPLPCLVLATLLTSTAAPLLALDIPVTLLGPHLAAPTTGPHTLSVKNPVAGVTYTFTVTENTGTLVATSEHSATFRTGTGQQTVLTCRAVNSATGDTGFATHRVLLITPAQTAPLSIQVRGCAGKGQGPLVAWVDKPMAGVQYLWTLEGGEPLDPPPAMGNSVLFRAGTGDQVILNCLAFRDGAELTRATHGVELLDSPPAITPGFAIQAVAKAPREVKGLEACVSLPDETLCSYKWSIEGGHLDKVAGPQVLLTTGTGNEVLLRCLATRRDTGAMEVVEHAIGLQDPMPIPEVQVSERIYEGQSKFATVTNRRADDFSMYSWTFPELEDLDKELTKSNKGVVHFRARKAGPAQLTCRVENMNTMEVQVWTKTLQVLPAQARCAPVRIKEFRCDPASPWPVDAKAGHLSWTLEQVPDTLVLRNETTGQRLTLEDPKQRSFPLSGPFHGRQRFSLTTTLRDRELDEDAVDTWRLDIVVPGVSVVAGDAEHIGSSYMRSATREVTPWGNVTGLAWQSDWLYFSQGDQHTIRRVRPSGGPIEEVAGMRGIPATGAAGQDLLCGPGQLIHREFTLGSERIDDWLVLQPAANSIQVFSEGQVAATLRKFGSVPPAKEAKETKRPKEAKHPAVLKEPTAMAVHAATGHVFVADRGNQAIKMFSPNGDEVQILAQPVEAGGIAVNEDGDVFFSDTEHHVVRVLRKLGSDLGRETRFAPAELFAGAVDAPGAVDGKRTSLARFRLPTGLAMDSSDQTCLVVADTGNHLVRKVSADLETPHEVLTIGGNIHEIKTSTEHLAQHPSGIVARLDAESQGISLIMPEGKAIHAIPESKGIQARGVALDLAGNLYFSDPGNHVVRVLRLQNPPLGLKPSYAAPEVFAGKAGEPDSKEGGRVSKARLRTPTALALDPRDPTCLLITDRGNQVLWRVPADPSQDLEMKHAGKAPSIEQGVSNGGFKDGPRGDNQFFRPQQMCADGQGRLFVQDQAAPGRAAVIRGIDASGSVTTLGGINRSASRRGRADGSGDKAGFDQPRGIAVDQAGVIYVADSGNRCIRRIAPDGQVTVAAGSGLDSDSDMDNCSASAARFDALGYLGVDFQGRLVVLEPRRKRLRMVDLKSGPGVVSTPKSNLPSELACIFPASAKTPQNFTFVLAAPVGEHGQYEINVMRNPSTEGEIVDPATRLQALCADRANRIWAVLPPDPSSPGNLLIRRYSCRMPRKNNQWAMEEATLPLAPGGLRQTIDGRPYALCANPVITAIATDSHNNLFLADSGNGLIWKVDEALQGISQVAGKYPYLGPVGRHLQSPLVGMQGIALTPEDDVLVTSGDAVLRVVQARQEAARPWIQSEIDVWTPTVETKARVKVSAVSTKPSRLADPQKDLVWQFYLNKARTHLTYASDAVPLARAEKLVAEEKALADPTSRYLVEVVESRTRKWAGVQQTLELATAEDAARRSGYEFLLLLDQRKLGGLQEAAAEKLEAQISIAKADSFGKQARFEFLEQTAKAVEIPADDPGRAAVQVRLGMLKAVQEAMEAELAMLNLQQAMEGPGLTEARLAEALDQLDQATAVHLQKTAANERAGMAVGKFNEVNEGDKVARFLPWTTTEEKKGQGSLH